MIWFLVALAVLGSRWSNSISFWENSEWKCWIWMRKAHVYKQQILVKWGFTLHEVWLARRGLENQEMENNVVSWKGRKWITECCQTPSWKQQERFTNLAWTLKVSCGTCFKKHTACQSPVSVENIWTRTSLLVQSEKPS